MTSEITYAAAEYAENFDNKVLVELFGIRKSGSQLIFEADSKLTREWLDFFCRNDEVHRNLNFSNNLSVNNLTTLEFIFISSWENRSDNCHSEKLSISEGLLEECSCFAA